MRRSVCVLATAIGLMATGAQADVIISNAATRNISCSGGVCAPTAKRAVLNAGDLEALLAAGDVEVTTTGSKPREQATNIDVDAPLGWPGASTLSLDSYQFLTVTKPISVTGTGGLSLKTNDGGSGGVLLFQGKGHATFANLASPLSIDGQSYTLVDSIASLAAAVARNSSGYYALANDYNAQADGVYTASPISEQFDGTFEGLGNTISHLRIRDRVKSDAVGLFAELGETGAVNGLRLSGVDLLGGHWAGIGGIVGGNNGYGSLVNDSVSGTIQGLVLSGVGGLAGCVQTVSYSSSSANVSAPTANFLGGLAGCAVTITSSYATGTVTVGEFPRGNYVGGLVGEPVNPGMVANSYATGAVMDGRYVGGLVGGTNATVSTSYSTGAVSGAHPGGFIGLNDDNNARLNHDYWDVTTSGTKRGAGKGSSGGVTGLTSQQLQTGLPAGFDPTIWAESPGINNGFPYLLDNPPLQ